MAVNLKKLFILILMPLIFSSCQFLAAGGGNAARNPQSEADDSVNEPAINEAIHAVSTVPAATTQLTSSILAATTSVQLSNIDKLCSLPREFTNPILYDQYCGNSCRASGNSCEEHSDCCSHRCSGGVCQPGGGFFIPITQKCQEPSNCETGLCQPHPTHPYKICYGSLSRGICEYGGEPCLQNDNCCSNRCHKNKCAGSPSFPSGIGQPCYTDHSECASNQCNFVTRKCR